MQSQAKYYANICIYSYIIISPFKNFSVIPPATGIIHQINLEYLSKGLLKKKRGKETTIYPDSLVGTDSHTTMINGLGVLGWGVGGIEAEAVMLGEPIYMLRPEVIGFNLHGKPNADRLPFSNRAAHAAENRNPNDLSV